MQVETSVALGGEEPALEIPWTSEDGVLRYVDLKSNPALISELPEARLYNEMREFLLRINGPDLPLQTAKSDIWWSDEMAPDEDIYRAQKKLVSYVDLVFVAPESRASMQAHEMLIERVSGLLERVPEMPASVEFVLRHCYYHQQQMSPLASPISALTIPRVPLANRTVPMTDAAISTVPSTSAELALPLTPAEPPAPPEPAGDIPFSPASDDSVSPLTTAASLSTTQPAGEPPLPPAPAKLVSLPASADPSSLPTSLQGFCVTLYISGFGGEEVDTRQRWSIALKLVQHALVQVARSPVVQPRA